MNRSFITYYFFPFSTIFHFPLIFCLSTRLSLSFDKTCDSVQDSQSKNFVFHLPLHSPFRYLLIRQDAVRDSQSKNFVFHLPLHSPFTIFEAGNHHIFILKS